MESLRREAHRLEADLEVIHWLGITRTRGGGVFQEVLLFGLESLTWRQFIGLFTMFGFIYLFLFQDYVLPDQVLYVLSARYQ